VIAPDDYTTAQRERIALIFRSEELVANCRASGDWTALDGVMEWMALNDNQPELRESPVNTAINATSMK
jgi:hypothetical protein